MLGKIRIDTHGQTVSKFWDIYLNDVNINHFVRNISIDAGVNNQVPKINIEIIGTLDMSEVFTGYVDMQPLLRELEHAKSTIERLQKQGEKSCQKE